MTGNWFAAFALFSWPLICVLLFKATDFGRATLWSVLGAQLFLPAGIALKLAMIPQFDKASIPSICILLAYIFLSPVKATTRKSVGLLELLSAIYIFSPFITASQNGDLLVFPDGVIQSVGLYDGASSVISQALVLIPLLIGRVIFASPKATEYILQALTLAGLLYSLPMLFEIRMSPELQAWIYGYMPGEFYQQYRGDTFRPVVFMGHGLATAFFTAICTLSSCALWRADRLFYGLNGRVLTGYLSATLLLGKSFGAILYAIFLLPLMRLSSPKVQMRVAVLLASFAIAYPMLRFADLVPTQSIIGIIGSIDKDRAGSLQTRFENEDQLLKRALERPLFGWGRYGRSRVYNQRTGVDESITDGRWVITLGQYGLMGFLAEFGLLGLCVFRAASALKSLENQRDKLLLSAVALIVAVNMIELLPNSALTPLTWLLGGSLLAAAEAPRRIALRRTSGLYKQGLTERLVN